MKSFKYYTVLFVFFIIGAAFIFGANERWQQTKELVLSTNKQIILHTLPAAVYQNLDGLKRTLELHSLQTIELWHVRDSLGTVIMSSKQTPDDIAQETITNHVTLKVMIREEQDMWSASDVTTDKLLVDVTFKEVHATNYTLFSAFTLYAIYILMFIVSLKLLSDSFNRKRKKLYHKINSQAQKITRLTQTKDELTQTNTTINHDKDELVGIITTLNQDKNALVNTINKQRIGKSLFVADLCHEIKTPLTALYAMINMVTDHDKFKIHGKKIQKNQLLLSSFLDDFIELAKSENGEFSVHKTWCNLNSIVEEAVDIAASKNTNRCEIIFTHAIDDIECLTDALRMKQISINLLTNAMKYGGNFIHLDISFDHARDDNLILTVRDYGRGISHDTKENIFQAFERGGLSEDDEYEGIGLGLHIIANICNSLGASIKVYDAIPQGAIFEVRMKCETRQLDCLAMTRKPSNIAFVGEKSPVRLALSQAYSDCAFIDTFVDEYSFLEHLSLEKPGYDLIISHDTYSNFKSDVATTLGNNEFTLLELSNPNTYQALTHDEGPTLGRLTPTVIKQLVGDIASAHHYHGNVLLLDDTPGNTLPIRQMTRNDYTLMVTDNIHDAMLATKATTFSLILVDLKLFDGELGYDFITRSRLFGRNKQSIIYAYTASSVTSLLDFCILAGADSILEKPVAQHLTINKLINARSPYKLAINQTLLPDNLLTLSGALFLNDVEQWQREINNFLSRENATARTIFDEVFTYILTLKKDADCEQIVDYLMGRLHKVINEKQVNEYSADSLQSRDNVGILDVVKVLETSTK